MYKLYTVLQQQERQMVLMHSSNHRLALKNYAVQLEQRKTVQENAWSPYKRTYLKQCTGKSIMAISRSAITSHTKMHTIRYLSFGPIQKICFCDLSEREKYWRSCARGAPPACSPTWHCKQCSALTSPALRARGNPGL